MKHPTVVCYAPSGDGTNTYLCKVCGSRLTGPTKAFAQQPKLALDFLREHWECLTGPVLTPGEVRWLRKELR